MKTKPDPFTAVPKKKRLVRLIRDLFVVLQVTPRALWLPTIEEMALAYFPPKEKKNG